jgi:hypothetical protein
MSETSYNGWPASPDPHAIGVVPFTAAGVSFPPGVKGGDVAYLFHDFLTQYDARVERLKSPGAADEWGYSYRRNRNANNLSCHASGTAVDVNAQRHPNGQAHTLTAAQVKALRAILAVYEGVIKWGGDFAGTKDEMHYEIHGTKADVTRVAAKVRWLRRQAQPHSQPAKPATTTTQGVRMIVRFESKPDVYEVVGSHLEHITKDAFEARGLTAAAVKVLPDTHPLSKLERR